MPEDSISVINSSADLACKNNPDAASKVIKRAALSTAAFYFEMQNFIQPFIRGYVKDEDKEKCDDAGKLV